MDGDGNRASGDIMGDSNTVDILQQGNDNWVGKNDYAARNGVVIDGDFNSADIDQLSNGNMSVNTVFGNSNSIVVTQN